MRIAILCSALGLCGLNLAAQPLLTGQVLGVNGTANVVDLVDVGAATASTLSVPTGGSVDTILWDPDNPNRAYVAGYIFPRAYISRLDFSPAGIAVTKLVDDQDAGNPLRNVTQLSWRVAGGVLVAVCANTDQIYEVDVSTVPGTVSALTSGVQPWGNALSAGIQDPVSSDIYAASSTGSLYRITFPAPGTPNVTTLVSGLPAIHEVVFDPRTGTIPQKHILMASNNDVWRVDLNSTPGIANSFLDASALGLGSLRSLTLDESGGYMVGNQNGNLFRVPVTGGSATAFATLPLGWGHSGLAVVGGGQAPWTIDLFAIPGGGMSYSVQNVPAGLTSGFTLISTTTWLSAPGTGPFVGIWPDALTMNLIFTNPFPTPGDFFHWTTAPVPSLFLPPGALLSSVGQTWDFVMLGFTGGSLRAWTPVARVTLL